MINHSKYIYLFTVVAIFVSNAIFISNPVIAQDNRQIFEPAGGWKLTKDPRLCILKRDFGKGKNAVHFKIGMGLSYEFQDIEVSGRIVDIEMAKSTVWLQQNDQEAVTDPNVSFFRLSERPKNGLRWYNNDNVFFDRSNEDQNLSIYVEDAQSFKLMLGNMNKAIDAIQKCQDELYENWGIDAKRQRQLQKLPTPKNDSEKWFDDLTYIDASSGGVISRIIGIKIDVNADGKKGKCFVILPSSQPSLNNATCNAIERNAQFNPAIGPDGNPADATFVYRVQWNY